MFIKIDKKGRLKLKRGKDFECQLCPFMTEKKKWKDCGDYCPLFKEPVKCGDNVILKLCFGTITCHISNFKDKR